MASWINGFHQFLLLIRWNCSRIYVESQDLESSFNKTYNFWMKFSIKFTILKTSFNKTHNFEILLEILKIRKQLRFVQLLH